MKISFTGSRTGLTDNQKKSLGRLLYELGCQLFIHGDCKGADIEAHEIALELGSEIVLRPCNLEQWKAYAKGAIQIHSPEDPLVRNKKIVDDGDLVIACPDSFQEKKRSGTWSTIRYAKTKKDVLVVYPDGVVDYV